MGGNQSKPARVVEEKPDSKGKNDQVNHDRFKGCSFERNGEEDNIKVRFPIPSEQEFKKWEHDLQECPTEHEYYLMPVQIHLEDEGICGSTHFLQVFYEHFPHVLANEILNRSLVGGPKSNFKQGELWYMLYVLTSAVRDFHMKNKKVGDIRPSNVFISNEGQIKVATYLSFPSEKNNYEKTLNENQLTYLSPQELKDLKMNKSQPSCNMAIAQSFAVGLTCLDSALLESSAALYLKNNNFDVQQLERKLQRLEGKGYDEAFVKIITDLCCIDPKKRVSCLEIYELLQPYEEKIMSLQQFQLLEPQKMQGSQIKKSTASSKYNTDKKTQMNSNSKTNQISPFKFAEKVEYVPYKAFEETPKKLEINTNFDDKKQIYSSAYTNSYQNYSAPKYYQPLAAIGERKTYEGVYKSSYDYGFKERDGLDARKKEMERIDLEKIDKQLELSRKMFPK